MPSFRLQAMFLWMMLHGNIFQHTQIVWNEPYAFHSWCPPAACFRMADKMGVYLEVEMPMWGADAKPGDEARNDFFRRELRAILKEYGNHLFLIIL